MQVGHGSGNAGGPWVWHEKIDSRQVRVKVKVKVRGGLGLGAG